MRNLPIYVDVPCIGTVEVPWNDLHQRYDYSSESTIRIQPSLVEAFRGIGEFSHLWVIYHQHLSEEWLQAHGWGTELPLIVPEADARAGKGIYTTRAPCRPSRLGSCIVALVSHEKDRLVVRGLDALNGTQVLDVKIYIPSFDAFPHAVVPEDWTPCKGPLHRQTNPSRISHECHQS